MKTKYAGSVPASIYIAALLNDLTIKGRYGYITVNHNLIQSTVFVASGIEYKVNGLVKIDGFANAQIKISRCDQVISEGDKDILKEGTIIKSIYIPISLPTAGYDLK